MHFATIEEFKDHIHQTYPLELKSTNNPFDVNDEGLYEFDFLDYPKKGPTVGLVPFVRQRNSASLRYFFQLKPFNGKGTREDLGSMLNIFRTMPEDFTLGDERLPILRATVDAEWIRAQFRLAEKLGGRWKTYYGLFSGVMHFKGFCIYFGEHGIEKITVHVKETSYASRSEVQETQKLYRRLDNVLELYERILATENRNTTES